MGISNSVDEFVKCCKGIQKLLSLCGLEDYKEAIQEMQEHEFWTVTNFMSKYYTSVSWKDEMNILTAAKLGIHIQNIGLDRKRAGKLVMCMSYLVNIDEEGIPTPYFFTVDDYLSSEIIH